MRINAYIAKASSLSRRAADTAISNGRVKINGTVATLGQQVTDSDTITLDGQMLSATSKTVTIMLNKPVGYVCSKDGQGGKTVYDLLPKNLHALNLVGRLDKDSSGLILLTNDGELAHKLTHPSFEKAKVYQVELDKTLTVEDQTKITRTGVNLDDGLSKFDLKQIGDKWQVTMHEGRNRQIRRTFEALGYKVTNLHRTQFGPYKLGDLQPKQHEPL